jgi:hypothetical protein
MHAIISRGVMGDIRTGDHICNEFLRLGGEGGTKMHEHVRSSVQYRSLPRREYENAHSRSDFICR